MVPAGVDSCSTRGSINAFCDPDWDDNAWRPSSCIRCAHTSATSDAEITLPALLPRQRTMPSSATFPSFPYRPTQADRSHSAAFVGAAHCLSHTMMLWQLRTSKSGSYALECNYCIYAVHNKSFTQDLHSKMCPCTTLGPETSHANPTKHDLN